MPVVQPPILTDAEDTALDRAWDSIGRPRRTIVEFNPNHDHRGRFARKGAGGGGGKHGKGKKHPGDDAFDPSSLHAPEAPHLTDMQREFALATQDVAVSKIAGSLDENMRYGLVLYEGGHNITSLSSLPPSKLMLMAMERERMGLWPSDTEKKLWNQWGNPSVKLVYNAVHAQRLATQETLKSVGVPDHVSLYRGEVKGKGIGRTDRLQFWTDDRELAKLFAGKDGSVWAATVPREDILATSFANHGSFDTMREIRGDMDKPDMGDEYIVWPEHLGDITDTGHGFDAPALMEADDRTVPYDADRSTGQRLRDLGLWPRRPTRIVEFNPLHAPAGSPHGGEFAKKGGVAAVAAPTTSTSSTPLGDMLGRHYPVIEFSGYTKQIARNGSASVWLRRDGTLVDVTHVGHVDSAGVAARMVNRSGALSTDDKMMAAGQVGEEGNIRVFSYGGDQRGVTVGLTILKPVTPKQWRMLRRMATHEWTVSVIGQLPNGDVISDPEWQHLGPQIDQVNEGWWRRFRRAVILEFNPYHD